MVVDGSPIVRCREREVGAGVGGVRGGVIRWVRSRMGEARDAVRRGS